jgi:cob(I)alamin adenosyltransferase
MSISTKTGDAGQTGLFTGERVWKDDLRVDAYGTLDELDAHIGEAKHVIHDDNLRHLLIDIQQDLYRIMAQLASRNEPYAHPITQTEVEKLTELVYDYEQKMGLKGFVLPGSTAPSAKLDVCRAIARRAERRIVTLSKAEEVPETILQYINRLSDFFFILARWIEWKADAIVYMST